MKIHGLQKMTLLDYPGKVACLIFFAGCNLRCPFCHNASLVTDIDPQTALDSDEVLQFLQKRTGLLDGVCISGGEPCLVPHLDDFIGQIKQLGYCVKLDTNGTCPDTLSHLIESALVDYVAMDIKNCKSKYPLTTGVDDEILPNVERSIGILLGGKVDYEFRTTVADELHTVQDIEQIAHWIGGAKRYFIQPFVDSGDLVGQISLTAPSSQTLAQMQKIAQNHISCVELRGI